MQALVVVVEQAAEGAGGFDEGVLGLGWRGLGRPQPPERGDEEFVHGHEGVGVAGKRAQKVVGRRQAAHDAVVAQAHKAVERRRLGRQRLPEGAVGQPVGEPLAPADGHDEAGQVRALAADFVVVHAVGADAAARVEAAHLDVADEAVERRAGGVRHLHPRAKVGQRGALVHLGLELARGRGDDLGERRHGVGRVCLVGRVGYPSATQPSTN